MLTPAPKTVLLFGAALSDNTEATTGAGKASFTVTRTCKIAGSSLPLLNAGTAPSGSTLIVDINKNGTSIFSTRLTIDSGETNSSTAATAAVLTTDPTTFVRGDVITFDLDQVGAVTPGAGIVCNGELTT